VINYAYLWHHEHTAGNEEGRKDRPSVIILSVERDRDGATIVVVLPITHTPPRSRDDAIELPPAVKRHLGLDDDRSWVIITEGNQFVWPGYDIRKIPDKDGFDYGFIPPRLFDSIRKAFVAHYRSGRGRTIPRS
jgi:hypothetical protein